MITKYSALTKARLLKSLVRRAVVPAVSILGSFNDELLSILIAGSPQTLDYICRLAFGRQCSSTRKGFILQPAGNKLSRSDCDIVVVEANPLVLPLFRSEFWLAPSLVRSMKQVTGNPDQIIAEVDSSDRHDLRRLSRRLPEKGYSYHVTTDEEWLRLFYETMYKPYVASRFADLARVRSYDIVRRGFEQGGGISIERDGSPVAGAVFALSGDVMCLLWKGVANGDMALVRDGVSFATYYYALDLAYSRKCKTADFGYSPPFLSDSTLAYKLKWNMYIEPVSNCREFYAIAAPGRTEQAMRFLQANRFYVLTDGGVELCHDY